tara:strand:- start:7 stop:1299 length:1293 start_codon:yes stop_codon:yes gene_type:complete
MQFLKRLVNESRIRFLLVAMPVALLWVFFHPLAKDALNITVVAALILTATLALSYQENVIEWIRVNRVLWLTFLLLCLLAATSSVVTGGSLSTVRDVVLISGVALLGIVLSVLRPPEAVLSGLVAGATIVATYGWVFRIIDGVPLGGLEISSLHEFEGVGLNQGYEAFSALVGVASALGLLKSGPRKSFLAVLPGGFLAFTLLFTGSIYGWFALGGLLLLFISISAFRESKSRIARVAIISVNSAYVGVLASAMIFQSWTLSLTAEFGKATTLEARFLSWGHVFDVIGPWGAAIGHGAHFWEQGSVWRENFSGLITQDGYGPFSHSHNEFIDLFLAFGVLGVPLVGVFLGHVVSNASRAWREKRKWILYTTPWFFFVILSIQGLGTTVLVSRPAGWFLAGALAGIFAFRDPSQNRPLEWAPSGSNRRPTD